MTPERLAALEDCIAVGVQGQQDVKDSAGSSAVLVNYDRFIDPHCAGNAKSREGLCSQRACCIGCAAVWAKTLAKT